MRNFARFATALIVCSANAAAANPSFIFNAVGDPSVFPVLERYLRSTDFVGVQLVAADPQLGQIAGRQQQVDLAPSLAWISIDLRQGCGAGSPGAILYNLGAEASPPQEVADPLGSIASAAQMIHAGGCDQAGILPYGQFWAPLRGLPRRASSIWETARISR
jgi:hypothetical protein